MPCRSLSIIACFPCIQSTIRLQLENQTQHLPGGAVLKNLPASAGDGGKTPGLGRLHVLWSSSARGLQSWNLRSRAHAPRLLKPYALEPVLRSKRSPLRVATRE